MATRKIKTLEEMLLSRAALKKSGKKLVCAIGTDSNIEEISGSDSVSKCAGVVRCIPLVEGASTTEIIRKVLERFENNSRS